MSLGCFVLPVCVISKRHKLGINFSQLLGEYCKFFHMTFQVKVDGSIMIADGKPQPCFHCFLEGFASLEGLTLLSHFCWQRSSFLIVMINSLSKLTTRSMHCFLKTKLIPEGLVHFVTRSTTNCLRQCSAPADGCSDMRRYSYERNFCDKWFNFNLYSLVCVLPVIYGSLILCYI